PPSVSSRPTTCCAATGFSSPTAHCPVPQGTSPPGWPRSRAPVTTSGTPTPRPSRPAARPSRPTTRPRRRPPMRDAMAVLIRPVVSEKSYGLMDQNVYVFIVDPGATKIDVRHAVEQAFSVRVLNVNTLNRKGKSTRNRRTNTKRAIVTIHPDDSIDLFDR